MHDGSRRARRRADGCDGARRRLQWQRRRSIADHGRAGHDHPVHRRRHPSAEPELITGVTAATTAAATIGATAPVTNGSADGAADDATAGRHRRARARQRRCVLCGVEPVRRFVAGGARGHRVRRPGPGGTPRGDRLHGRRRCVRRDLRGVARGARRRAGDRRRSSTSARSSAGAPTAFAALDGAGRDRRRRRAARRRPGSRRSPPATRPIPSSPSTCPTTWRHSSDEAGAAFAAARVPLTADPSMVITAETPLTDEYLATACPDQGSITGSDVVDG